MTDQLDPSIQAAASRNGFVWEIGNGLAKTTVVTYLARELGADGMIVGFILAAPYFAGTLRLATPWLLRRFKNRQLLALFLLVLSSIAMMLVPVVGRPGFFESEQATLWALSISWGVQHLILYLGVVVLFSWFGEIVPGSVRGRFLGGRERWNMAGSIVGALLSGGLALAWTQSHPRSEHWWAYILSTFCGGAVMLFSNRFLLDLPATATPPEDSPQPPPAGDIFGPLAEPAFRQFLIFAMVRALAAGLTQAAIGLFAPVALRLPVLAILALESMMRVGQSAAAPAVGKWMDLRGNRGVLIASQFITAVSLIFFFPATKAQPWWIIGVYLMWIAFVGLNVGLYRTMLSLAPRQNPARHVALYYSATDLAVGIGAIVGGLLFELMPRDPSWRLFAGLPLDRFQLFFAAGIILRLLSILPLWNWRDAPAQAAA